MNQKNPRLNLSDIILTVVLVILVLSISDLTAYYVAKIPIIGKLPILIWSKPENTFTAIIVLMILIAYLKFREYGPKKVER